MLLRRVWCATGCGLALLGGLYAFQRPFREFPAVEYNDFPLPADWNEKTEWVFARLMFPGGPLDGYRGRFDGDFRLGLSLPMIFMAPTSGLNSKSESGSPFRTAPLSTSTMPTRSSTRSTTSTTVS